MPSLSSPRNLSTQYRGSQRGPKKNNFRDNQKLAKQKAYEKKAKKAKVKLEDLAVFTQQLSSMLHAGLPLVSALEALQEQVTSPVFQIIIRDIRVDVSSGTAFSEAAGKFKNAFPKLFISMLQAGEASGNLADILEKTAGYFEESVKLAKKVKSALTYPVTVILFAIGLVNVLLIFVIPVFAEMFTSFGSDLPMPTQILMSTSEFMQANFIYLGIGLFVFWQLMTRLFRTPRGRLVKDWMLIRMPVFGELIRKVSLSRFCRTFAILMRSGVPILQALEIVSSGSNNTYIERACWEISRNVSQGGQISEVLAINSYFPSMIKHMTQAGEQTGDVDGMLVKIADFYDVEIENTVSALTSLLEPLLIVVLGVIIGGIVMAMFLPIFKLPTVIQ